MIKKEINVNADNIEEILKAILGNEEEKERTENEVEIEYLFNTRDELVQKLYDIAGLVKKLNDVELTKSTSNCFKGMFERACDIETMLNIILKVKK